MKDSEYRVPKSKKCYNCYWFEYENVYSSDRGKCRMPLKGECTRIKENKR